MTAAEAREELYFALWHLAPKAAPADIEAALALADTYAETAIYDPIGRVSLARTVGQRRLAQLAAALKAAA